MSDLSKLTTDELIADGHQGREAGEICGEIRGAMADRLEQLGNDLEATAREAKAQTWRADSNARELDQLRRKVIANEHETQASVTAWQNATFPHAKGNLKTYTLRALEEMVELCIAAGNSYPEIMGLVDSAIQKDYRATDEHEMLGAPKKRRNPAEEMGDVQIVLYGCADAAGVRLQDETDKKMVINRARKWRIRTDGHADHVKEGA